MGPNSFWDFQQGNGLRQVIAQFGQSLYYYTNDLAAATLIETNAQDIGQWDFVEANNILFGTNTLRSMKWLGAPAATGGAWQNWGIQPAATPPTVSTNTSNAQDITGVLLDGATAYVQARSSVTRASLKSFRGRFGLRLRPPSSSPSSDCATSHP